MTDWKDRFYEELTKSEFGTISEVCKAAGVSNSTFGNALKGSHVPKISTFEKVAQVLGVTWQYLMNGEGSDLIVDTRIPVLSKSKIVSWLQNRISLDDVNESICAPGKMPDGSFAIKVRTSDMAPIFPQGSFAVMCTDIKINIDTGRIFVLAADMRVRRPSEGVILFDEPESHLSPGTVNDISGSDFVFAELARTLNGLRLVPTIHGMSESLDARYYKVIAKALYSIQKI